MIFKPPRGYSAIGAYGRSKLCNILFTRELARRWIDKGVTANCLHPGFVATRFVTAAAAFCRAVVRVAKLFAISPGKGAETIVYLASSPDVGAISGEYFYQCRPATPTAAARDERRLIDCGRSPRKLRVSGNPCAP